ncbi:MAG: hypothetical protein IJ649_03880 [Oscillospiraceae bacterium]|nr:hypothetical protein [Oscillospiraceae bacterium]
MTCVMRPTIFLFFLEKRKTVPRPVPERKERSTRAALYLPYRFTRGYRTFPLSGQRNDTFAAHPSALNAAYGRRKTAFTDGSPRSIAAAAYATNMLLACLLNAAAYARAAARADFFPPVFPRLREEFLHAYALANKTFRFDQNDKSSAL